MTRAIGQTAVSSVRMGISFDIYRKCEVGIRLGEGLNTYDEPYN